MNQDPNATPTPSKTDLLFRALAGSGTEATCCKCGVVEQVIALDNQPLDEVFLANYHCDECDDE